MKKTIAIAAVVSLVMVFINGCETIGNADNRGVMEQQGFIQTGPTQYVKPNAYGPGVGMNQFGAPVKTVPAYGGN